MSDSRTEDELRAALEELSRDAPTVADVLPGPDATTLRRRWRRSRWAPVAAAAAVMAVAIGLAVGLTSGGPHPTDSVGLPSPGPATRSAPPAVADHISDLAGIDWQLRSVGGQPAQPAQPAGFDLRIEPDGRFWQSLGTCISLVGHVSVTTTQLKITRVSVSSGLCPNIAPLSPRAQKQVTALKAMILGRGDPIWSVEDRRLTLRSNGVPTITYLRCPSGLAVYELTVAEARACGYTVYPLTNVTTLPDGGTSYSYDVNGHVYDVRIPPANFNPLTATHAQLVEYGIPLPAGPNDGAWQSAMRAWRRPAPAEPFLLATTGSTPGGTDSTPGPTSSAAPQINAGGMNPVPSPTAMPKMNPGGMSRPLPRSLRPRVPAEFRPACGHPGARVSVQKVPVTVSHAACDLTGVTITYRRYGGVVVPRGRGGAIIGDGSGFRIEIAPSSLDVAVTTPRH